MPYVLSRFQHRFADGAQHPILAPGAEVYGFRKKCMTVIGVTDPDPVA
jgi:hypothetical protein